jgi:ankyrin repeat protein/serine/threonine protein kinase
MDVEEDSSSTGSLPEESEKIDETWPALHTAAWNGDEAECVREIEMLRGLIELSEGINLSVGGEGNTPAQFAVRNGNLRVLELLVEAGADLMVTSPTGSTVLHASCHHGSSEVCAWLLGRYRDANVLQQMVNTVDDNNGTPAMVAARSGHVAMLQLLVEAGADLMVTSPTGSTVLHANCHHGSSEVCAWLLGRYRDANVLQQMVNTVDDYDGTPAMVAARSGHVAMLQLLVEAGADLMVTRRTGSTVLHSSCHHGSSEVCAWLLGRYRDANVLQQMVNTVDNYDGTPAMIAARSGHVAMLQLLVEAGADLMVTRRTGSTALHASCHHGSSEVCAWLLGRYRDANVLQQVVNTVDDYDGTPAMVAAGCGHVAMLQLLVEAGADLMVTSPTGSTVLHASCHHGSREVCAWLLGRYRDANVLQQMVNTVDDYDGTPAKIAAENGQLAVLQLLAEAEADLMVTRRTGSTVLYACCWGGNVNVCERLLGRYRDENVLHQMVNTVDDNDGTPAMVAARSGHVAMLQLLVEAGADLMVTSRTGSTVLHACCRGGRVNVLEWLLGRYRDANVLQHVLESKDGEGNIPAMVAVKSGNLALLLKIDFEEPIFKIENNEGCTLLHLAACLPSDDVISYLLHKLKIIRSSNLQSILDQKSIQGFSPALLAAANGHERHLGLLLEAGCDILSTGKTGHTILHCAAFKGNLFICKLLFEKVLDAEVVSFLLNSRTNEGDTALHLCLERGAEKVAEYILQRGPEIVARNSQGRSALHTAAARGLSNIVNILVNLEADLELKCNEGLSALQLAALNGHMDVVKLLLRAGAVFDLKCDVGYNNVPSSAPMLMFLRQLVQSGMQEDREYVRLIASRKEIPMIRVLVEYGYDFAEAPAIARDMNVLWLIADTDARRAKYPIHCTLRRWAGTTSEEAVDQMLKVIDDNEKDVCDVDYFGQTPTVAAVYIGAPASVLERILQLSFKVKSKVLFSSRICLNRCRQDGLDFPTYRQCGLIIHGKRVYMEVTIHSNSILQVGVATANWHPGQGRGAGAGETKGSIAVDGSIQKCYLRGRRGNHIIPRWKLDTIVGIGIDGISGSVQFWFDGEKLNWFEELNGDEGYTFVFSAGSDQTCELNFGECKDSPLLYKPEGYNSVKEYVVQRGASFIPALQMYDKVSKSWEYVVPPSNKGVSKYYYDISQAFCSADNSLSASLWQVIKSNMSAVQEIANDTIENGQRLIDVASPRCRQLLRELLLFNGRYELMSSKPDYESHHCAVFLAKDTVLQTHVAIKLMNSRANFDHELEMRSTENAESEFVISVHTLLNGENNEAFRQELERRGYPDHKYCIIMPAARRNLYEILGAEKLGTNVEDIRRFFQDLVRCVEYIHSKEYIHGDIKPQNIMRSSKDKPILIDLDASCKFGELAGRKLSPAYVPPEMLHHDQHQNRYLFKNFEIATSVGVVVAHASFDVWSLGVVLYEMFVRKQLFPYNHVGDIDDEKRRELFEWEDSGKQKRLGEISDLQARNLVARMLSKSPEYRPSLSAILQHPFVSLQPAVRLVGEEPTFDVFISYRVNPDRNYCYKLRELLKQRGLNVWTDSKIRNTELWEEKFCNGLAQSKVFVCLISAEAVANSAAAKNFVNLTENSLCDNVLLEHQLALELHDMSLVSKIFPVFIGKCEQGSSSCETFNMDCLSNMPHVSVHSVKQSVAKHVERLRLGSPLRPNVTVKEIVELWKGRHGPFLVGDISVGMSAIADLIVDECRVDATVRAGDNSSRTAAAAQHDDSVENLLASKDAEIGRKNAELASKDAEIASKDVEIRALKEMLAAMA